MSDEKEYTNIELTRRVLALEESAKANAKLDKRFQTYKEEIVAMLEKYNKNHADETQKYIDAYDKMAETVNMIFMGVNRAEARINRIWNTFNGFVRFMANVLAGKEVSPGSVIRPGATAESVHAEQTTLGGHEPYWTTERLTVALLKAGKAVFEEAAAHEKKEFERMKAEKAKHGKVLTAAQPRKGNDPVEALHAEGDELVRNWTRENQQMIQEKRQLIDEAQKAQRDPDVQPTAKEE